MIDKWLFTRIDNSSLIVFRIIFGALVSIETFGAILTGWVQRVLIAPEFTFHFIGFDFLQPLPGSGMLWYYGIMGVLGICIMLGLKYRLSTTLFFLMWTGVYLMQKSSYNNHYYLLMLLSFLMIFVPAHRYASIDVLKKSFLKKISMPRWCSILLIFQLWIMYTFAGIAKLYPDWLNTRLPAMLMQSKEDLWLIGDFLQQEWIPYALAYFGLFLDLLIIPLLLIKKTRIFALFAAVFFHLFNSLIFHIGIFPYLSLAFLLFFFPAEKINRYFLPKKPLYQEKEVLVPDYKKPLLIFLSFWFILQISLPLRHWYFKDDVLWTEEGHRLSWRMMLRSKAGSASFLVVDSVTRDTIHINNADYLTPKQMNALPGKPDMIWQFAQHLERGFAEKGKQVEVYAKSKISVNRRPYKDFIDPKVNLAAEQWQHFSHHDWILPSSAD